MRITRLSVKNFGPYKGLHVLDFPPDATRNVMVVFGDNMRGKTSILNAFRWVLYGEAHDRQLKPIEIAKLVNKEAAAEGDWTMEVFLDFELEGHRIQLRRTAKPKETVARPRRDGDFFLEMQMRRDGDAVRGDQIEDEISQILPRQVSRFALFDGELLQEYELLLYEDNDQGDRIKGAIEQVLGVPSLTKGRDELKALRRKAEQRQAQEASSLLKNSSFRLIVW